MHSHSFTHAQSEMLLTADHRIDNQWVAIAHPAKNSRVGFLQLSMVTALQSRLCLQPASERGPDLCHAIAQTRYNSFLRRARHLICRYLHVTLIISVDADFYICKRSVVSGVTAACPGTRRRFAKQVANL